MAFSGDLNNWLFNIETLAEKRPVIAIDLPGPWWFPARMSATVRLVDAGTRGRGCPLPRSDLRAPPISSATHWAARWRRGSSQITLPLAASLSLICPSSFAGHHDLGGISGRHHRGGGRARANLKPVLEMLFADPTLVTKDMAEEDGEVQTPRRPSKKALFTRARAALSAKKIAPHSRPSSGRSAPPRSS